MEHYGNFKDELKKRTDHAEKVIRRWLPEEKGFARIMAETMNYSMCVQEASVCARYFFWSAAGFLTETRLWQSLLWQESR